MSATLRAVRVRVLRGVVFRHSRAFVPGDLLDLLPDDAARLASFGVVEVVRGL